MVVLSLLAENQMYRPANLASHLNWLLDLPDLWRELPYEGPRGSNRPGNKESLHRAAVLKALCLTFQVSY